MSKKPARHAARVSKSVSAASPKKTSSPGMEPTLVWPLVALFILLAGWLLYRQVAEYRQVGGDVPNTIVLPKGITKKSDVGNLPPKIVTYVTPQGVLDQPYKGSVTATDPDANEKLTMVVGGFPLGISKGTCSVQPVNTPDAKTQVVCQLTGTAKQAGTFMLTATVTDEAGHSVRNDIPLSVGK